MDRNNLRVLDGSKSSVALRKESVDRNCLDAKADSVTKWSLSARRAWIEMMDEELILEEQTVALRKESVDRNFWCRFSKVVTASVALRKESVDRNKYVVQCRKVMGGRSPQGERG